MIERAVDHLRRLVAFDTVSSRSNRRLIDWIAAFLDERGHPFRLVEGEGGSKANLIARIGPDAAGGVLLSGHSDVVPVEGQSWSSDPWTLTLRDGKYYGRGAADMKGFIALALALIDEDVVKRLQRPIMLAITYDEEVGCLGAPDLIARLDELVPRPRLAIIGEPTSMKAVSVHKGMRLFDVEVIGREAHSSRRDEGVSAITVAADLMALIGRLDAQARSEARADDPCDPPGTTLSVGLVEGGTATNILARRCAFSWDLRASDTVEADRYEALVRQAAERADAAIRAIAPEGGVTVTRRADAPPLERSPDSAAESFVRSITGDNDVNGAAFVAEAGLYQRAGLPAILCGPGSIRQAHQPDEWIAADQLRKGADFLTQVAERLT